MNLMSNVRLMILLVLVALSAYSFFSATTFSSGGVFVSSVDQGAGCVGLVVGGRVNQVGGRNVKTVDDFDFNYDSHDALSATRPFGRCSHF